MLTEKYNHILTKCSFFCGIDISQLYLLFKCMAANEKHYDKNEFIFLFGEKVTAVGIVLSGCVHIMKEDFWGTRTIIASIETGGLFGEAFSCAEMDCLPVSVLASRDTDILFIDYRRIIKTCNSSCSYHTTLITNMVKILAQKNIMLTQKMEILTQRTTREKLLAYLSIEAAKNGKNSFEIPFNRQELAEYLSVDRSAMSAELSKMRNEGILNFNRNKFALFINEV